MMQRRRRWCGELSVPMQCASHPRSRFSVPRQYLFSYMVALTDAKRYKVHELLLNATEVPESKVRRARRLFAASLAFFRHG